MASDVQPKAAPGTLWKPAPREKKPATPLRRTTELPRPTEPMRQQGKAFKGRAVDKKSLLKREPANHEGYHQCYIGLEWTKTVDLEHVIDASLRPDLENNPHNHKKACNYHNIAKKEGRLTPLEEARVQDAIANVLHLTENEKETL